MDWKVFRKVFDKELEIHIKTQLKTTEEYIFSTELENIYGFLLPFSEGGKRIRPYLVFLMYKLSGGEDDQLAIQAGIINELIHLFALIHDDINDKGTIRHHLPTFHMYAAQQLNDNYQGINMGILVGDFMLSRAYQHLQSIHIPYETKVHYFTMLNTTIYGQIQDVYLSHTKKLYSKEIISMKDKAKSGDYSIMRPMVIGYNISGQKESSALQKLGERLGVVFQMRDDLLDIIDGHGNKTSFSDHQEGNQTFLLAHAYELATDEQKECLLATRGTVCDDATKKQLLDIYTTTGTIIWAREEVNKQLTECTTIFTQRVETTPNLNTRYAIYVQDIINFLAIA